MAGVIGLRGPDIEKRDALRGFKVEFRDADRPIIRPTLGCPVLLVEIGLPVRGVLRVSARRCCRRPVFEEQGLQGFLDM